MPLQLPPEEQGAVYWVTGLAGAGKTTVAEILVTKLRAQGQTVVFLDGDVLREVFGGGAGHSMAERRVLAHQYGAMCRMLSRQGMTVVCATISMFGEVRQWNRENIVRYCEVYLQVPMEVLVSRDKKGLYRGALAGEIDDVIGVNAPFEEPECPDIMIENDGARDPEAVVSELLTKINLWSEE